MAEEQRNQRPTGTDKQALRAELQTLDEELAVLRSEVDQIRRRLGEHAEGPTDPAETAATLTNVEEQEALVGTLEARRQHLLKRLGEGG